MKNKIVRVLLKIVVVVVIVALAAVIINQIIDQIQYERCLTLKDQNGQGLVGFYITKDEKEMCDRLNITVNAPVYEVGDYIIYDR